MGISLERAGLWTAVALASATTGTAEAQRRAPASFSARTTTGSGPRVAPLARASGLGSAARPSATVDGLRRSQATAVRWETAARTALTRGSFREAATAHRAVGSARAEEAQHLEEIAHTLDGVAEGHTGGAPGHAIGAQASEHLVRAAVAHHASGRAFEQAAAAHARAGATDSAAVDHGRAGQAYRLASNAQLATGNRIEAYRLLTVSAAAHERAGDFGNAAVSVTAAAELIADREPAFAGADYLRAGELAGRAGVLAGNTSRPWISARSWHGEAARLYTTAAQLFSRQGSRADVARAAHASGLAAQETSLATR